MTGLGVRGGWTLAGQSKARRHGCNRRAVGRRVHLLGGLEVWALLEPARNVQEQSGCVGKIEARLSPNCLNIASPSAANWHPTAHVSGSQASFWISLLRGPDHPSLPVVCTLPCKGSEHGRTKGPHVVAVSLPRRGSPAFPRVASDASRPAVSPSAAVAGRAYVHAGEAGVYTKYSARPEKEHRRNQRLLSCMVSWCLAL